MRELERGVRSFKGECCCDVISRELESSDMIGLELTTAKAHILLLPNDVKIGISTQCGSFFTHTNF